jgi:hypothetical protein
MPLFSENDQVREKNADSADTSHRGSLHLDPDGQGYWFYNRVHPRGEFYTLAQGEQKFELDPEPPSHT